MPGNIRQSIRRDRHVSIDPRATIAAARHIPVASATMPTARATVRERTGLVPQKADPVAIAVTEGIQRLEAVAIDVGQRIEQQIAGIAKTIRVAQGLDAADDELDQLRTENQRLTDEVARAYQQIEQLRAILTTPDKAQDPVQQEG